MADISELFQRSVQLHQAGQVQVAAQGYAAILRVDPGHADAWHLSGLVAHQSGRSEQAIDHISRAIELNPHDAEYYSNLSAILLVAGHWSDALTSADQAIAISDRSAVAYFQKARAHAKLGQAAWAVEAFENSRARGFDAARVSLELSDVWQAEGDLEASARLLDESLRLNPQQSAAWFSLSRLVASRSYELSSAQVQQMTALLEKSSRNGNDRDTARLAFALAAHCDCRQDFDRAFQLFCVGNEASRRQLTQAGHVYNPDSRTRLIDDLIEFFTADRLKMLPAVSDSRRPIVVIGMPRSGTSLVERILASHVDVAAGGEQAFWTAAFHEQFGRDDTRSTLPGITLEWRQETAIAYDNQLRSVSPDVQRVVDKMPGNYLYVGLIATAFPQATILHCRRDPRDTCLSNFSQLFDDAQLQLATSDLSWIAQRFRDCRRLMEHWKTVLPGRIADVVYERLVQDPQKEVARLLHTCDLSWSDDCLRFHRHRDSVRTASAAQVRQPLYQRSRGRWTGYREHLQPLIDELGDCLSDAQIDEESTSAG